MARKGAIKSPKDLEGKRIGVNVINSTAWLHAVAWLEKHDVDRTKVRFSEVPFPQMNDPLLAGQLDAIVRLAEAFLYNDVAIGIRGDYERLRAIQAALLGIPHRPSRRRRGSSVS